VCVYFMLSYAYASLAVVGTSGHYIVGLWGIFLIDFEAIFETTLCSESAQHNEKRSERQNLVVELLHRNNSSGS
jgi:hypothetical protein